MSYTCYQHGWSDEHLPCPQCQPIVLSSATTDAADMPLPSKGQEGEADERITNEGLRNFLINADKPHYIGKTREIINLYYREEISLSRLNEMLNEIVYHWKTKAPAP